MQAPVDDTLTIEELTRDPYPVYRKFRSQSPVIRVASVGRTMITKAQDTRHIKDNPSLFSSDDPQNADEKGFSGAHIDAQGRRRSSS